MLRLFFYALIAFLLFNCNSSRSLFQSDTQDWFIGGDAEWEFEEQEIIGTASDDLGFVMSKDVYKDFILTLEFYPDSTVNSGIFVRCANKEINPTDCYELNIWDLHPNQDFRTGALVTKAKSLNYVETIGQWNTYEIRAEGNRITAKINDVLVVEIEEDGRSSGFIALQAAGIGRMRFRKVRLKSL